MNNYIISLDKSTADQEKLFIEYLNSKKWIYWHWISGTWLIKSEVSIIELNSLVMEKFPGVRFIVNRLDVGTWRGFGPKSEDPDGRNMFRWLHNHWKPKL